MAKEALQKLKEAEDKSLSYILNAQKQASEIVQKALDEQKKLLTKAENESLFFKQSILKKAIEETEEEYEPILLKTTQKINSLNNLDEAKINSAINMIIERIVKIDGNS